MNRSLSLVWSRIILILRISLGMLFAGCGSLEQFPTSVGDFPDTTTYIIEPNSILAGLNNGNSNIFIPAAAVPQKPSRTWMVGSFAWRQADYTKIGDAAFMRTWQEPRSSWEILQMFFVRVCQSTQAGFDTASFWYIKPISNGFAMRYDTREIDVVPLHEEVQLGSGIQKSRPLLSEFRAIDLQRLRITADDALQLAEAHGGREARVGSQNECSISVKITDGGIFVAYDSAEFAQIFAIRINPYTAAYDVIAPAR